LRGTPGRGTLASLLTCLGYRQAGAAASAGEPPLSPADWEQVAFIAANHGVAPLLYHRLQNGLRDLPAHVAQALREEYLNNTARTMRLEHELARLLGVFNTAGIPTVLLKGIPLARVLYDQPGLRTMSDIDLLVCQADLERSHLALQVAGYACLDTRREVWQSKRHFQYSIPGGGGLFELHWDLANAIHGVQVDLAGLWSRALLSAVSGQPCLVMHPVDQLLHLCLHCSIHTYNLTLRMLVDIAEFVRKHREIDWNALGSRAAQWGITRPVYVTLRAACDLLGAQVSTAVLGALKPATFDEAYISTIYQHLEAVGGYRDTMPTQYLAALGVEKNGFKKLGVLLQRLFPSRKSMSYVYPAAETSWRIWLYYPVRWAGLVSRYSRLLWRILHAGTPERAVAAAAGQNDRLFDWLFPGYTRPDRDL
jgi:hypothetical protein